MWDKPSVKYADISSSLASICIDSRPICMMWATISSYVIMYVLGFNPGTGKFPVPGKQFH